MNNDTPAPELPETTFAPELIESVCAALESVLPEGLGYALFLFDGGEGAGRVGCASNAPQDHVLEFIGTWLQGQMNQLRQALLTNTPPAPPVTPRHEPQVRLPAFLGSSRLSLAEIGALLCCACAALHGDGMLPDALAVRMASRDMRNALTGLRAKGVLVGGSATSEGGGSATSAGAGWKLCLNHARHPKDAAALPEPSNHTDERTAT